MDLFTRDDLKQLAEAEANPAVSIYMPTYRTGREVQQNAIRFKNLVSQAQRQLTDQGLDEARRAELLREAKTLEGDEDWWQHQSDGLALFMAAGRFDKFRIPLLLDELVVVGRRFHVRPMVRLTQNDGQFYLLAVSQNKVRLMAGTHHSISELELDELPSDLRSALNVDEYTSSLQQHSAGGGDEAGSMLFHGHGGADMDVRKKDEILQFFRLIDTALCKFFGSQRTPMVFAGVEYLFPLFRDACNYSALVETPVAGNPDELSAEDLHPKAWSVVAPLFDAQRNAALERYGNLSGSGKALASVTAVAHAARQGAVDTLLLAAGARRWGVIDQRQDSIVECDETADGAEELLNYAAIQTLSNGGSVYSLSAEKMPDGQPAAALLRFELA